MAKSIVHSHRGALRGTMPLRSLRARHFGDQNPRPSHSPSGRSEFSAEHNNTISALKGLILNTGEKFLRGPFCGNQLASIKARQILPSILDDDLNLAVKAVEDIYRWEAQIEARRLLLHGLRTNLPPEEFERVLERLSFFASREKNKQELIGVAQTIIYLITDPHTENIQDHERQLAIVWEYIAIHEPQHIKSFISLIMDEQRSATAPDWLYRLYSLIEDTLLLSEPIDKDSLKFYIHNISGKKLIKNFIEKILAHDHLKENHHQFLGELILTALTNLDDDEFNQLVPVFMNNHKTIIYPLMFRMLEDSQPGSIEQPSQKNRNRAALQMVMELKKTFQSLVNHIKSKFPEIRWQVAVALGTFGRQGLPYLELMLQDQDERVVGTAKMTIRRINHPRVTPEA